MVTNFLSLPMIDQFRAAIVLAISLMVMSLIFIEYAHSVAMRGLAATCGLAAFGLLASYGLYATHVCEEAQQLLAERAKNAEDVFAEITNPQITVLTKSGFTINWRVNDDSNNTADVGSLQGPVWGQRGAQMDLGGFCNSGSETRHRDILSLPFGPTQSDRSRSSSRSGSNPHAGYGAVFGRLNQF